ncbi:hypothetical protein IAT38_008081 [Cryptococcus sp. DSM 104549]
MSKRLSKRNQRAQEELQALQASTPKQSEAVEEHSDEEKSGPANAFAALGTGEEVEEEEEEEEEEQVDTPSSSKKSKKKKSKKSKKKVDPFAGLDEVDRALAELKLQYGEDAGPQAGPSTRPAEARDGGSNMVFRNLLSVDPKNLDADAELRRFFGSKVIATTSTPNKHRPGASASSKLRYTISKPKPQYPPATSLAGLVMREMGEDEVEELYERRERERGDKGEKWFTFEHAGVWREVERQFMGAVQSHDPNQLMALLSVYPWHVDTLLQMSEVYRLQSDIGAASDYAERALYAFDRCLLPSFNVLSGASRLDFDRVENRPMFTALHRIISYLGRRGCWVTAFNFAKLLYALDPENDPHGAAFWLDFLAIKSNNGAWLLSMLEQANTSPAAAYLMAYPGWAYAKALALRADEEKRKSKDHTRSDGALQEAITDFPQVVPLLADKIGASMPDGARSNPLFQVEAGYTDAPTNTIHLLSHIYVSRSEALWKDPSLTAWFESQLPLALPNLTFPTATLARDDIISLLLTPRDPADESINTPLFVCRHVLCSESTAWVGFLPPGIREIPVLAYDPVPPTTATSIYDAAYFNGVRYAGRRVVPREGPGARGAGGDDGEGGGMAQGLMNAFRGLLQGLVRVPENAEAGREVGLTVLRQMLGDEGLAGVPEEEVERMLDGLRGGAGAGEGPDAVAEEGAEGEDEGEGEGGGGGLLARLLGLAGEGEAGGLRFMPYEEAARREEGGGETGGEEMPGGFPQDGEEERQ